MRTLYYKIRHAKASVFSATVLRRVVCAALCLCLLIPLISGMGTVFTMDALAQTERGTNGVTLGVDREADYSTMDTYKDVLDFTHSTRYAGRVWMDKTVFAYNGENYEDLDRFNNNTLQLTSDLDGYTGEIALDEDFLHVYSAMGSSLQVNESTPLDVMFLVDVSGSMGKSSEGHIGTEEEFNNGQLPINKSVEAINSAISSLQSVSPESRFGIAVYGATAAVLLPLGHYEKENDTTPYLKAEYLKDQGNYNSQGVHFSLTVTAKSGEQNLTYCVDNAGQTNNQAHNNNAGNGNRIIQGTGGKTTGTGTADDPYHVGHITNPQAGLAVAMDQFITHNNETTWQTYNGEKRLRIPAMIHLTDGQASDIAWIQPTANENGEYDWQKTMSNWNNVNWQYDLAYNSKNQLSETSTNVWNASQLTGTGDAAPVIFQTLMTASYYKSAVEKYYNKDGFTDTNGSKISLKCYSVYASSTEDYGKTLTSSVQGTIDAILGPEQYFKDYEGATVESNTLTDVANGGNSTAFIDTAYELYKKWMSGDNVTQTYNEHTTSSAGDSNDITITLEANKNQLTDGSSKYNELNVTSEDIEKNINYVPQGNFFQTGFDELNHIFDNIITQLLRDIFAPVGGANNLGVDNDAITYMDPIGKYMEVKDIKNLLLFGQLYGVKKTAMFDYDFASAYTVKYENGNYAFLSGWYKLDANGNWLGADSFPEDRNPTAVTESEYYNDGSDTSITWDSVDDDGSHWVYYLDATTSRQFVPSLPDPGAAGGIENLTDAERNKLMNTVFTFYRLDEDDDIRDELHMNPAYGDEIPAGTDGSNYTDVPGVYKLSDIRVWVEDTGEYNDDNIDQGGVLSDAGFDESLMINIPVSALPIEIVTIDVSDNTGHYTYSTSAGEGDKAAHPLRVFYTVGIEDSLLTVDGYINIAGGVDYEYVKDNKITTSVAAEARDLEEGYLEFFSNWYNHENRYSDYSTTNTDFSYGDAIGSFSPASENRYYIFEKALPLYSTAYVYVTEQQRWRRVNLVENLDSEDGDVRAFDPLGFGGKLIAIDLEPETPTTEDDNQQYMWDALQKEGISREDVHDGDIVLLKSHRLSDVTAPTDEQLAQGSHDPFSSEDYFYLPIEYFELDEKSKTATPIQYVIARKGSEFGSAYQAAGITNGDMLCWYDVSGKNPEIYPYLSYSETGDASRGRNYIGTTLDPETGYYEGYDAEAHEIPDSTSNTQGSNWNGGEWVVSAKPGGLRVGDLAQDVGTKAFDKFYTDEQGHITSSNYMTYPEYKDERFPDQQDSFSVGYYAGNVTRTANNYYMPTISAASVASKDDIIVNVYLGNNGRLSVADTTLLMTKTVVPGPTGIGIDTSKEFQFQIFIDGNVGQYDAIVVRYNEATGNWQRQLHYIDLDLDSKLFLQNTDGTKTMVDKSGRKVVVKNDSSTDPSDETVYVYADDNSEVYEANDGGPYYVFIGTNTHTEDASSDTGIGASMNGFRLYHNPLHNNNAEVSSEDVIVEYLDSDGNSIPNPDFNSNNYPCVIKFYLPSVWLFTQEQYDAFTGQDGVYENPDNSQPYYDKIEELIHLGDNGEKFYALTLDTISQNNSEVSIETQFRTASGYLTQKVYFGYKAEIANWLDADPTRTLNSDEANAFRLMPDDLYDPTDPSNDRPNFINSETGKAYTLADFAANTAEITLRHGFGLLFAGMDMNTNYRITEKLTNVDISQGYSLDKVMHSQQFGSWNTYMLGENNFTDLGVDRTGNKIVVDPEGEEFYHSNALLFESYATFAADAAEANHHHPNGVAGTAAQNPACKTDGTGADELQNDGSTRHYFVKNGELIDKHYQGEQSAFNANRYVVASTARFFNRGHAYSVFGNTGIYEESGHFYNLRDDEKKEVEINGEPVTKPSDSPDGKNYPGVATGDEITYKIDWLNEATDDSGTATAAQVVITDTLDDGSDFVSASEGGTYYDTVAEVPDNLKQYVTKDRTVVWVIDAQAGETGDVTLTIRVNDKAKLYWDYDMDGSPDDEVDPNDFDYLVRNRATVWVNDNSHDTNVVQNPVGTPDKNEVKITGSDQTDQELTDEDFYNKEGADNTVVGPLVYVGDKITYEITWRNYENVPATITIRDPLDPNVKFISASFDPGATPEGYVGAQNATLTEGQTQSSETVTIPNPTDDDPNGTQDLNVITFTGKAAPDEEGNQFDEVVWNLGVQPAGAEGKVILVVEVLGTATNVGYVDNTAYVKVNGDAEQQTKTVENPTPKVNKTEPNPGNGEEVILGQHITYEISWDRKLEDAESTLSRITITDPLDPGVDFYSASYMGVTLERPDNYDCSTSISAHSDDTVESGGGTAEHSITITYDPTTHTVTWILIGKDAATVTGSVSLTVVVNDKAVNGADNSNLRPPENIGESSDWNYRDGDALEEGDQLVQNRAAVQFNNDSALVTELMQNPLAETGSLTVKKVVTDTTPDTEKEFTFTVKLTAPENGKIDLAVIKTEGATVTWTPESGIVDELTGTFVLRHDEYVTISGIPAGTTYEVRETERNGYNLKGITDTFGNVNVDMNAEVTSGVIEESSSNGMTFNNSKAALPPSTGGIGRFFIYLTGAVLLALAPIAYLGFRKRYLS